VTDTHTHTHTHTHTSHNIHVREILILNAIHHYDEVRGEINPLYFSLLFLHIHLHFNLVIIVTNQSTIFLNYITINLGKLNDTKPTILEVRHPHIDLILQGFVLL
jgi:hypothetical protein